MIPKISRKEWAELVTGKLKPVIESFSLQMKLNSVINHYKNRLINIDEAVKDLYTACEKHYKIYKKDLDIIFNNNNL